MRKQGFTLITLLVVIALAAFMVGLSGAAFAQGPPPGPGGPGGFGGPPRGMMGPPGMMGGSPTRSNLLALIVRPEVQNEIHLDVKQKKAIMDLQQQTFDQMRERMQQNFQDTQNLSPEERRQRFEEMRSKMESEQAAVLAQIAEKVKAILRPEQNQRLRELDLQLRGPLSLADSKVADEIKIAAETRPQINKLVSDFESQAQQVMRQAFEEMRQNGGPPPGPGGPGGPGGPDGPVVFGGPGRGPDFENRLSPIRKKRDALKKDAENKVLALLTDDEKARWKAALGEPFKFRPMGPPPIMRQG